MIEIFLYYNLLLLIIELIVIPFIFFFAVAGIEGLKDGWDMITHKDYYLKVIIPTFIMVNVTVIIGILVKLLIFKNYVSFIIFQIC